MKELTCTKFVDLCILLGCDYLDPVPKVGPSTAYNLICEHKTLENVVDYIKNDPKKKYTLPDDWPYLDARTLVKFLVTEKGFSEDRVRSAASRLTKNLKTAQQARMEGFFKPVQKTEEEVKTLKRKNEEKRVEQKKKHKAEFKAKKEAKAKPKLNA